MAIEDHPLFGDWSRALDHLKDAKDNLQHAVAFGEPKGVVDATRLDVIAAQLAFNNLCDEIA